MGFSKFCSACSAVIIAAGLSAPARADVVTDGSVGAAASLAGPNFLIEESLGQVAGSNLFHSFSGFSLTSAETATFNGASAINNIIARVTGGSLSSIDGSIDTTAYSSANLFLMNPNGVVFGPNATLSVNGSFHTTTADYLKFSNGETFFADPAANSVLSIATPSDFGFLSSSPAGITVDVSTLIAAGGETISLVGGDIYLDFGWLLSDGGRINLAAVGSAGEVGLAANDLTMSGFSALGDITMLNNSLLRVDGTPSGDIFIRGGNLTIQDSIIDAENFGNTAGGVIDIDLAGTLDMNRLLSFPRIRSRTFSSGTAGGIDITAETIHVTDGSITTETLDFGDGGALSLHAANILLDGVATISSDAHDLGNAGLASVTATNNLTLNDIASINSDSLGFGDGGGVMVSAGQLVMTDSSYISSKSNDFGNGGNIQVSADDIDMSGSSYISSDGTFFGNAGFISVQASDSITLNDTARISSNNSFLAYGGMVDINAARLVLNDSSKVSADALETAAFDAGDINISVANLILNGSSRLSSVNNGSGIGGTITINTSDTLAMNDLSYIISDSQLGDAGNIIITAETLNVADIGSITSNSFDSGNAGSIVIDASTVSLSDSGFISTNAYDYGDGGNIQISADDIDMSGSSYISSDGTFFGNAGFITVQANDSIALNDSARISSNNSGLAFGGMVNINADRLVLNGNSKISADAEDGASFDGGDINVNVANLIMNGSSRLNSVNGGFGTGGTITVNASDTIAMNDLSFIDSNALRGGAGNINLSAETLDVADIGSITSNSFGFGDAGSIVIDADTVSLSGNGFISSNAYDSGRVGSIDITAADSFTMSGIAYVTADAHGTAGGGSITVNTDSMSMNDNAILASGSFNVGDAGDVTINAATLSMSGDALLASDVFSVGNGGTVNVSTTAGVNVSENANINTNTSGAGNGGAVNIMASGALTMNGGSITTDAFDSGAGGSINIMASNISMDNGALISSQSFFGSGNAGDITLTPVATLSMDNSVISTEAEFADGGNINILTRDLVYLHDSAITTTVRSGVGNGGNITIDPTFVSLDNGRIIANAFGGNGGNIDIVADFFISTPASLVQASSQLGIDGNVNIDAVQTDISGDLSELPANYLDATALLREPCAARSLQRSSFVVVGRGALPMAPGSTLSAGLSDLAGAHTQAAASTQLAGDSDSLNCGS